ncbi:sulfurtransferase complex subunit TusC [Enterobacteriaceae endosymbiont of Macroplea appendiculata]|uniref:sulfurtransferase complex subunit TusC n=1 Tax=Enterobacteriaceae endosymbiont of Macroplea appendiculata TaxID=2675790 RepID=UPI0014492DCF|nr:sulfurtransferase complex subunit TusC [Enterobacteriaceae endosymbiont of Macroplea appendiculata]QJC30933.1 sulfurtransferase complex subunit TusC [Enterobacteriaceae endosymbiont of Macroplea appendiculata]
MNNVAIIFSKAPYGNNSGQEGLDIVISISSFIEDIALFFISDGVLQIKSQQKSRNVFLPNNSLTFKMLLLCNINKFFVCEKSMNILGINDNIDNWVIPVKYIQPNLWNKCISHYDIIMNF